MKTKLFQFQHQVIGNEQTTKKPNELSELRSTNDIEVHVEKVEKRATRREKKMMVTI